MLAAFYTGFWHFFFSPATGPWYTGNVWGNVVATIPLALLGMAAFFWHRGVVRELHEKLDAHAAQLEAHGIAQAHHAAKLLLVLDALDPGTDGGITEIHNRVEEIADTISTDTPGGLKLVLDRIDKLDVSKNQSG